MKGFLRACLPLYPSDFRRFLVVLLLTDFWISSPHFCAKLLLVLSGLLSPIFLSAKRCLWRSTTTFCSLDVSAKSIFSQVCLKSAYWSLGLFYNLPMAVLSVHGTPGVDEVPCCDRPKKILCPRACEG